jgi:hypothetical protein
MSSFPCSTPDCSRTYEAETEKSGFHAFCFKCKISSGLYVCWVGGGGYGRDNFTSRTNADVIREQHRGAEAQGRKIEPIPQRAVLV